MSRGKINQPPLVLTVESLSDGKTVVQPMVDDWTGQVIEHKAMLQAKGPLPNAQELILADRRKAILNKRLLLEHVGMLPKSAEYAQAKAEDKPIKQSVLVPKVRVHSKHQAFELTFKPKPKPKWRRV